MQKKDNLILFLLCIIVLLIVIFVGVINNFNNEKDSLSNGCGDLMSSEEYNKFIYDKYTLVFSDNIRIIFDNEENIYLQADGVPAVVNKYEKYRLENAGFVYSSDGVDVETIVSLEGYKLNVPKVKKLDLLFEGDDNNTFIILLDNGKIMYIKSNDILAGDVNVKQIDDLSNIDAIYSKEKNSNIYAKDVNGTEYEIDKYIK